MMQEVSFPRQGSGRGCATMLNTNRKLMWASFLCTMVISLKFLSRPADALPVLASSLGYCQNVTIKAEPKTLDCCLPAPVKPAKRFEFPVNPIIRERKPAHVLARDLQYVEKYNRAWSLMKSRPIGDPLSFDTQWKVHCAFCDEAYLQRLPPGPLGRDEGIPLQVHYSWLFLPWHRMELYFHERMLARLINDDTFALPFWNWDNQMDEGANQIASLFVDGFPIDNSALRDAKRNQKHFPPAIMPLKYSFREEANASTPIKTKEEIIDENLSEIQKQIVNQIGAGQFFGGAYSFGTNFSSATTAPGKFSPGEPGSIENLHNTAHIWVGITNNETFHPDMEDMGTFIYSGKDPIFYTHHANIDRLWEVWRTLPDTVTPSGTRKREEFDDTDFLDTEFTFYDENAELVIVKVRDTFNITKLGIKYTDMTESDRQWIEYKPKNFSGTSNATTNATTTPSNCFEVDPNGNNTLEGIPKCFKISRRPPNQTDLIGKEVTQLDQLAEGVVIEELKIPRKWSVRFDAYISQTSATAVEDFDQANYVGSFSQIASAIANTSSPVLRGIVEEEAEFRTFDVRFSTASSLKLLGITNISCPITVTIVPKIEENKTGSLAFKNFRQDYQ